MRFLFILLVTTTTFLSAEIRFVSKTGSNTYPYTSWENSGRTIQGVMDSSSFGDTIYVGAGKYEEKIVFKRGISLIGIDRDSCLIEGVDFSNTTDYDIVSLSDSCCIKNFSITSSGTGNCIIAFYVNDVKVENNKLRNGYSGISIFSGDAIIINNIICECGSGIILKSPNREYSAIIQNNLIVYSPFFGIEVSYDYEAYLYNNNILSKKSNCIWAYKGVTKLFNNLLVENRISNFAFNTGISLDTDSAANNVVIGDYSEWFTSGYGAFNFRKGNYINNLLIGKGCAFSRNDTMEFNVQYNSVFEFEKPSRNFIFDSTNITTNPMIALQRGDSLLTLEDTLNPLSYIPQLFSPLIDGGHPDILDKDGTRSDIGLFGGPYGEEVIYRDYAPSIPKNLKTTKDTLGVFLSWNNSAEADLKNYLVYTDSVENFEITPFKLLTETKAYSIKVADSLTGNMFFKVVSVDSAGNKSFASEEAGIRKPVGLNDERFTIVDNNYLYQNYPNPFNPSTRISYKISKDGYLRLRVYDIKGELVEVIKEGTITKGYYEENYTPKGLASGMYILRIDLSDNNNIPVYSEQRKMLFVK